MMTALVPPLIAGCGSLRGAGPLYEPLSRTCSRRACTSDSVNTAFAREKLAAYREHFQVWADGCTETEMRTGNFAIFGAGLGIAAADAQSRDAIVASALIGVTPALFAQCYNLRSQPQIYERGARNFRCMSDTVCALQRFDARYERVPDAERTDELRAGYQELRPALEEVDKQIDTIVDRTREDVRKGVGELNASAIATVFEQYGKDLASAQEMLEAVRLITPPWSPVRRRA